MSTNTSNLKSIKPKDHLNTVFDHKNSRCDKKRKKITKPAKKRQRGQNEIKIEPKYFCQMLQKALKRTNSSLVNWDKHLYQLQLS